MKDTEKLLFVFCDKYSEGTEMSSKNHGLFLRYLATQDITFCSLVFSIKMLVSRCQIRTSI